MDTDKVAEKVSVLIVDKVNESLLLLQREIENQVGDIRRYCMHTENIIHNLREEIRLLKERK